MPSIIPSYVYSLFAAIIVGSMVVYTSSVSAMNIRNQAEKQQLSNITQYVATESIALISHNSDGNLTTTQFLDIPTQIGNQRYWINIANDSSTAWVESGFGTTVSSNQQLVYIPGKISASGAIISGSGRVFLECTSDSQGVTLNLLYGD